MKKERTFIDKLHLWGSVWSVAALLVLFSVPFIFSVKYDAFPELHTLIKALSTVILVYWSTAIIEVVTYTPLLGAGGTYLSFLTGNITNLKLPCAMNAMERANVKSTSEEGEVISTIAIAASSITTTIVIAVGVLAFSPVLPKIVAEGSVIKPAFEYVVPALFGALGASYFVKHWRISVFPIAVGIIVYIFSPSMAVGTTIFITIAASILGAFVMYKTGLIGNKTDEAKS